MHKEFLMGNAAIALGAVAAGVNVVAGYPGTPSTEVLETIAKHRPDDVYVEWSVNEKIQPTQRKSNNGYVWLYDFQYVLTPVGICQSYCLQNTVQFPSTLRNYRSWNSNNPCINYYCNYIFENNGEV